MTFEEFIAWVCGSVFYIWLFGIPCFIFFGMMLVSPAILILVYGVNPEMWVSTMFDLYPNEFFAISVFCALVIPTIVNTIKIFYSQDTKNIFVKSQQQEH